MKRISTLNRVLNLFGAGKDGFKNGNKAEGIPATELDESFCNSLQEEIANVIEGAGITLNGADYTQLRQAIIKMVQSGQRAVVINNATFAPAVTGTGKVVYWDSANSRFDLALADGTAKQNAVGVADVPSGNVYAIGAAVLFAGLTPGARYYLDATTAGAMTTTAPANGVYIGVAKSATEMFVDVDAVGVSTAQANIWTKGQSGAWAPLPATTGTVLMDFTAANLFTGQATGNITFGNGYTGPGAGKGGSFIIRVQQNGAALYNWAFASNWKYVGGSGAIPGQTQTLGAWDEIVGQVLTDGTISFSVRSNVA
ncbi:hypothetical protein DLREEDagrD3_29090 [Denitratisoma sp. agr-D3]